MDKFIVDNIPAFNGEYPIEFGKWTMRELQIIKNISGYRGGELAEGFRSGDTSLLLAVAVIAVRRNGKDWETFERIAWETDADFLTFIDGDKEAADEPTPLTQTNEPDANAKPLEQTGRSGPRSLDDGDDSPATTPLAIGAPL
jgi:hypothetical protein